MNEQLVQQDSKLSESPRCRRSRCRCSNWRSAPRPTLRKSRGSFPKIRPSRPRSSAPSIPASTAAASTSARSATRWSSSVCNRSRRSCSVFARDESVRKIRARGSSTSRIGGGAFTPRLPRDCSPLKSDWCNKRKLSSRRCLPTSACSCSINCSTSNTARSTRRSNRTLNCPPPKPKPPGDDSRRRRRNSHATVEASAAALGAGCIASLARTCERSGMRKLTELVCVAGRCC